MIPKRLIILALLGLLLYFPAFGLAAEFKMYYLRPVKFVAGAQSLNGGAGYAGYSSKTGAYLCKYQEVHTKDELLQAMGAEEPLSPGQSALLAVFEERQRNGSILQENQRMLQKDTPIYLVDLKDGMQGDPGREQQIQDFWPGYSDEAGYIRVNSREYDGLPPDEAAFQGRSLISHESTHSVDKAVKEADGYGQNGAHWDFKYTRPKAASLEAIAEYNQMRLERQNGRTDMADHYRAQVNTVISYDFEVAKKVSPTDLKGLADWSCVEGAMALALNDYAKNVSDGDQKIHEAFQQTNSSNRTVLDIFKKLGENHPEDTLALAKAIDQNTAGGVSNDDLVQLFPNGGPGFDEYMKTRKDSSAERPGIVNAYGETDENLGRPYVPPPGSQTEPRVSTSTGGSQTEIGSLTADTSVFDDLFGGILGKILSWFCDWDFGKVFGVESTSGKTGEKLNQTSVIPVASQSTSRETSQAIASQAATFQETTSLEKGKSPVGSSSPNVPTGGDPSQDPDQFDSTGKN
ncbi:MAG: hypothetical protein HQM08_06865 [Candidatus Riflebacteria bacterium]|nr:hypothetical protein [Candidatus Riflebacteria bacterium]